MKSVEITVFTATYNRAHLLQKIYESLNQQSYTNFEWLIIDDGSSDNTESVVNKFINEKRLNIRYLKKENGGLHTAVNKAIEIAKGRLFMILDSDDFLTENALERAIYWENTIKKKDDFAGVAGLRMYPSGEFIGGPWKLQSPYIDATHFERKKLSLLGDKAEVLYLEVLKKFYPIPVFEGENAVENAVLWNRIANAGYKIRWFNEPLYVCEYLPDGWTNNSEKIHTKNFKGYVCWKKELISMQQTYFSVVKELSETVNIMKQKNMGIAEYSKLFGVSFITMLLATIYSFLSNMKKSIKKKGKANA